MDKVFLDEKIYCALYNVIIICVVSSLDKRKVRYQFV